MKEFGIHFKKYDSAQAKCPFAYELRAYNELFGIYSIDAAAAKPKVAILEQISDQELAATEESKEERDGEEEARRQVLNLVLIKHNIFSDHSSTSEQKVGKLTPAAGSTVEEQSSAHRNYGIDMDISVIV